MIKIKLKKPKLRKIFNHKKKKKIKLFNQLKNHKQFLKKIKNKKQIVPESQNRLDRALKSIKLEDLSKQ